VIVIWNGAKSHPGGRQLFTEEHEEVRPVSVFVPAPLRPQLMRVRADVLSVLRMKPMTLRELIEATEIDPYSVKTAIQRLRARGVVEMVDGRPAVYRLKGES